MNWLLLGNSLALAAAVTAATLLAGLPAALALNGLRGAARALVLGGVITALALPSFVVVDAWLEWLGAGGRLAHLLPPWCKIYSLPGAAWVLSLMFWPIPCLAAWSAWQALTREHYESEPALRGWPLCRWLLWPAAVRRLALAAGLVAVLTLNHLAVPAILQVRVLPAEMWVAFNTELDAWAALQRGLPLMAAAALLLGALSRQREWSWPRASGAAPAKLYQQRLGRPAFCGTLGIVALLLLLSVIAPLVRLWPAGGWQEILPVAWSDRSALLHSWLNAAIAATAATAAGVIAHRAHAGRPLPMRGWEWGLWLPFFVPGVLLAVAWIKLLNRPGLELLYQSHAMMWLALAVRYFAVGWFGTRLALGAMDRTLLEAARLEGARGWAWFRVAVWPQAGTPLAAVWYLIYLLTLWDAETILLIQPPGGETLALRVFNLLHYGHHGLVNTLCLWLVALALLPLALWGAAHFLAQLRWRSVAAFTGGLACLFLATGCGQPAAGRQAPLNSRFFERSEIIGERGSGYGQFSKPRSVAVDRAGNVYAVDMTGRVQKFSPAGAFLLSWQMPETDLGKAKGMGVDLAGNILVVEPHYQRINHFTPDGRLVRQWGQRGTNTGQFILPRAIAVNAHGDYFIPEYTVVERVQAFAAADGRLLAAWGQRGTGPGEFNRPEGVAVDRHNRVYVADSCNHRIQIFDASGKFLRLHGKPGRGPGEFSYPYDIKVDAAGYQYVCEFGNSRIQILDAQDKPVEIIGQPGARPGEFNNPWAIALDADGNLYVADGNNHRLQKLVRRKPTPGK
ncbi:6-bladed beta-propeller [Fontisphaera persica]|uniref:6-bladed beta-propeller n=1 Tax=Fontisphaera persica TaxID=2974023 RepID=UPI0024BF3DEB|nr:6-bladed beta-propeller [Fontisphaera persica]WCJ59282.1 6-bladed beta-propeller [Fontisphaera persica]